MYNSSWLLFSRLRLLVACLHVLHNHIFQLIDLLYESLHQLVALLGCLQNLIVASTPTVPQTFFLIVFRNGISTTNRQVNRLDVIMHPKTFWLWLVTLIKGKHRRSAVIIFQYTEIFLPTNILNSIIAEANWTVGWRHVRGGWSVKK